jgi:hypothetical protein
MKIWYPIIIRTITLIAPIKYFINCFTYLLKKYYLQQSFPLLALLNFLKPKKAITPMKPKSKSISIILTLFYKVKLNPAEMIKSEVELFNPADPIVVKLSPGLMKYV